MNKTHARICELYLGSQMTLVDIYTVSRTIDRVLKFKKITDRGTEIITIQIKINKEEG